MKRKIYSLLIVLLTISFVSSKTEAQICPNSSNHLFNGDFSSGLSFWAQYGNVNAMVLPITSGCIDTCLVMPATNNSNSGVIQSVVMYKDTCFDLCYCIESPNGGGNSKVTVAAITSSVTQAQLLSGAFTASQAQILDSYVITTQFPAYQRCPGTIKATGNFTALVIINETFGLIGSDIRVDNVCLQSRLPCPSDPCDSTQAGFTHTTAPGLIAQFTDLSTSSVSYPITAWAWDFGDPASGINNTSTLQNPSHTYPLPGWYLACLYITAGQPATGYCYDTLCMDIYIPPTDPCDSLQAAFTYAATGSSVQFTDASTSPVSLPIWGWSWDFGDPPSGINNTSTLQNPVHVFSSPGWHLVCLYITAGVLGTVPCYDTICMDVFVPQSSPCDSVTAYYTYTSTGLTGNFTDQSVVPSGAVISSWSWNFGDPGSGTNNSSSLQNPSHTFTSSGWFIVCLNITVVTSDGLTCHDSICKDILIQGSQNPCDSVVAYYTYTSSGLTGNFTDQSLLPSGASISSWSWDFGDPASGLNNTSSLQNPSHVFTSPGAYIVCLYISVVTSDGLTCQDTICKDITIQNAPTDPCDSLQAWFSATGNLVVTFNDLSTLSGGMVYSGWSWNFGDPASGANNVSSLQNPVHNFTTPGIYLVCLIVDTYIPGTIYKCSDTICRDVLASQVLTGSNKPESTEISLFPNPGDGRFAIESHGTGISRVLVFNATGQLVLNQAYDNSPIRLPDNCKSGVYLVRLETADGIITRRLSVSRK
jgi:PKD repeat protein